MSWSIHFVGRAINVNAAIHKESERLTGESKAEFELAKPHLLALLELNQSEQATSGQGPDEFTISINAGGGAWWENGARKSSSFRCEIKRPEGTHV